MATQMVVRIEPDLKNKVSRLAKAEGKAVSEIVRELLEAYVCDRDVGAYIDDLWNRIGTKLLSRGVEDKEVQRVIQEVRERK